jgi:hypothetical protein
VNIEVLVNSSLFRFLRAYGLFSVVHRYGYGCCWLLHYGDRSNKFFTGPVDEDVAVFEAYKAIRDNMINDKYIGFIPTIVRLEYLSPLPLPVPPGAGDDDSDGQPIPVSSNRDGASNLSPWTIGASVASIMGGFVSILVWARARRFRQRRQQLMDETTSWVNSGNPVSSE